MKLLNEMDGVRLQLRCVSERGVEALTNRFVVRCWPIGWFDESFGVVQKADGRNWHVE